MFMVGMEEGLFPHARSLDIPGGLEEERRLCYVGITRAQRQLVMSYAETRRYYQAHQVKNMQSRFLHELPQHLVHVIRSRRRTGVPVGIQSTATRSRSNTATRSKTGVNVGSVVRHHKFGEGVVLDYEGSGEAARVQVKFSRSGVKWLVLCYANLVVES